jgi:trehalose 6-phosphate synthase
VPRALAWHGSQKEFQLRRKTLREPSRLVPTRATGEANLYSSPDRIGDLFGPTGLSASFDSHKLRRARSVRSRRNSAASTAKAPSALAARELPDALIVNPYSPHEMAERIRQAIEMEPAEVRHRMGRLRAQVRENNIYKWAGEIIKKLSKLT